MLLSKYFCKEKKSEMSLATIDKNQALFSDMAPSFLAAMAYKSTISKHIFGFLMIHQLVIRNSLF